MENCTSSELLLLFIVPTFYSKINKLCWRFWLGQSLNPQHTDAKHQRLSGFNYYGCLTLFKIWLYLVSVIVFAVEYTVHVCSSLFGIFKFND